VVKGLNEQNGEVRVRSLYCYGNNNDECYDKKTFQPIITERDLCMYNNLNRPPLRSIFPPIFVPNFEERSSEEFVRKAPPSSPIFIPGNIPDVEKLQEFDNDIIEAVEDLLWCTSLVFVYPTWWYGMPAILKGYFDRVMIPGVAFHYDRQHQYIIAPGLTHITKIGIVTTYGAPAPIVFIKGDLGRQLITNGLAPHCRVKRIHHNGLYNMDHVTESQRNKFLADVLHTYIRFGKE